MASILRGFTFAGIHSSTVGLYCDTPTRTIKPALRTIEYTVPGRSGTLKNGEKVYDSTTINCKLAYRANTLIDMRSRQRAVAEFLAASGPLIFDDEPDKVYDAEVPGAISMDEIVRTGTMEVTFRCQPFAESLRYRQEALQILPVSITPAIQGTQEAPCIIRIKAETDITGLIITRKRLS